ncbi:Cell wall synthesis protein KRE9 [Erysiphe necator]|uniref:Putative beta-glucan boisynthesis protein n=1 Tax=Uncinula necator TaxID=52586 RepID=A0A0B1P589_UNCNE|nr:Cell wall synthesis protein KRE9 [Erysiphe necator]KHJ33832.1 putative beta-glucan boisynthesis protein [Erysiphe necator]
MFYIYTLHALIVLLTIRLVHAYPQITSPAAGASIGGGTTFTVTWAESGDSPMITDLNSYELFLYTGSNTNPQQLYSIAKGDYTADYSLSVTIPVTIGGPTVNAYFLGLVSTAIKGGTITSFSDRFTLTGMKGTFPIAVKAALKQDSSISGPLAIVKVAAVMDPENPVEGFWDIPYNLQSGLTKYAPMQPIPPTAITATNTKALWPTSSVEFAKTLMPIPSQITTFTQSQTFSVLSHANTAAPASQPTNDMQKFLNRWKD